MNLWDITFPQHVLEYRNKTEWEQLNAERQASTDQGWVRVTPRDLTIAEILGLIVIARGAAMRLDDQGRTPAPVLELAQAPRAARRPRPRNRGA